MGAAELLEDEIEVGSVRLRLLRPRETDALIDESQFARDEYMPYWAELWPAAVALAREVETRPVAGADVLELGCGLALPSLVAAARGARVTAVDWAPEAIALLERNRARNHLALVAAVADWREPAPLVGKGPWDLVLASDVLYEDRNVDPLLALLPRLGREVLLAEPGRPHAARFLAAAAHEWTVEAAPPIYRLTR